uniref:Uncharacterized protein n=1 Tax=Cacopsylla melanoneura TaxID=428564 RepID=A0A8D9A1E2_9HEMI
MPEFVSFRNQYLLKFRTKNSHALVSNVTVAYQAFPVEFKFFKFIFLYWVSKKKTTFTPAFVSSFPILEIWERSNNLKIVRRVVSLRTKTEQTTERRDLSGHA